MFAHETVQLNTQYTAVYETIGMYQRWLGTNKSCGLEIAMMIQIVTMQAHMRHLLQGDYTNIISKVKFHMSHLLLKPLHHCDTVSVHLGVELIIVIETKQIIIQTG